MLASWLSLAHHDQRLEIARASRERQIAVLVVGVHIVERLDEGDVVGRLAQLFAEGAVSRLGAELDLPPELRLEIARDRACTGRGSSSAAGRGTPRTRTACLCGERRGPRRQAMPRARRSARGLLRAMARGQNSERWRRSRLRGAGPRGDPPRRAGRFQRPLPRCGGPRCRAGRAARLPRARGGPGRCGGRRSPPCGRFRRREPADALRVDVVALREVDDQVAPRARSRRGRSPR